MMDHRFIVIGGGFAGASAAARLREHGARVTLLEARAALGGRARSDTLDGVTIDTGAQLIASSFTHARRLLERAGAGVLRATPGRDIYVRDGARHPVHLNSIRSLLAFGGLGAMEKLRLARTMLPLLTRHRTHLGAAADRLPESLDARGAREYVRAHVSEHAADVLVEPLLGAFYAASGADTSLGFLLALGHYGSDSEMLVATDGWSRALERALHGVECETGVQVERLEVRDAAPRVVVASGERAWEVDGVVVATGPGAALELLRSVRQIDGALRDWLSSISLRRTVTLALATDVEMDRDAFGVFADPTARGAVSACAVHGAKHPDGVPRGRDVVLAWPTPERAATLADATNDAIVATMLPDIEALVPELRGHVTHARVYRSAEGTPLAHPGFAADRRAGCELVEAIVPPIELAGDYLTMPILEGAALSGERAADRLLERAR